MAKASDFEALRMSMVDRQIRKRGIRNPRVLRAMESVPRHLFVPERLRENAYDDGPLSIGEGQTISQPYMVAIMTECLEPGHDDIVLEIGTGSGYQTAILAGLVKHVFSIERIASLAERASGLLDELGYKNVTSIVGDGSLGWKDEAPFDGILVTAGAPSIAETFLEQLKIGGRLVIPVGSDYHQTLYKVTRREEGLNQERVTGCVFVPLIGAFGWEETRRSTL